jgi:hypothetical protein
MSRRCQLAVNTLEDRATPATFSYAPGTLTVTAQQGDEIHITPLTFGMNTVPGFVQATIGGNQVFASSATQPVKNLIVNPGASTSYEIHIEADVTLGTLSVKGAHSTSLELAPQSRISGNVKFVGNSQGTGIAGVKFQPGSFVGGNALIDLNAGPNLVNADGEIGGNLTINGGSESDMIQLGKTNSAARVGGNLFVDLRGGLNGFNLTQGTIGRNLKYASGPEHDVILLAQLGDIQIGGSATFAPGDGYNQFLGMGPHTVSVGKKLTYIGGTGIDLISPEQNNTAFAIGGDVAIAFGGADAGGSNSWRSAKLSIGGSFLAKGGAANDSIYLGESSIGGSVTAILGDGDNDLRISTVLQTSATHIGGGIKYVGGAGQDKIDLCDQTVGKSVNLSLGAGKSPQQVTFGHFNDSPVNINGNVSITLGDSGSEIEVSRSQIAGNFSLTAGNGVNNIWINDTDVVGSATFVLGNKSDKLMIDTLDNVNFMPVPGIVQIGGNFTVLTGGGDDLVDMSNLGGQHVVVGGKTKLVGGAGSDTFVYYKTGNVYLGTKSEDFELGEDF